MLRVPYRPRTGPWNSTSGNKLPLQAGLFGASAQPSKGRRVTVAKARAPRSFFKEGATLHPATMRLAAVLVVATFCASVVAAKNDFLGAWTPLERAARPPQRALRSPTVSSLTAGVPSAVRRAR
jgi:hypothetical protein